MTGPRKLNLLKRELETIQNENIKDLVMACVIQAPDYIFENCPSSSSGKYHPADELGPDGTIIHIKKMVRLIKEMCKAMELEHKQDELVAAVILHDLMKRGKEGEHTVEEHPKLAADLLEVVYKGGYSRGWKKVDYKVYRNIKNCILYHYGPWTLPEYNKAMHDYTMDELCLFLCDFITSRTFVGVEYEED